VEGEEGGFSDEVGNSGTPLRTSFPVVRAPMSFPFSANPVVYRHKESRDSRAKVFPVSIPHRIKEEGGGVTV